MSQYNIILMILRTAMHADMIEVADIIHVACRHSYLATHNYSCMLFLCIHVHSYNIDE